MKKILMILLGFMLSLAVNAQFKLWFNKISEAQIDPDYKGGINTMEGYVKGLIDAYSIDVYHNVLDTIERGSIVRYTKHLRELGGKFINEADYIDDMMAGIDCSKLYFVRNSKLYIITYTKTCDSLYLFRRDDKGWKIASNLIRVDDYQEGQFMRRFDSKTTLWGRNDGHFTLENLAYGSIHKISSGSIFVTFNTEIWYPDENYNYNSILVLVPYNQETYTATVFEPDNVKGKKVNNITHYNYDWSNKTWHKVVGSAVFPVLYGTRNTDYMEFSDGKSFQITYWDADKIAGTINFKIADDRVYLEQGTTIKLNIK